MNITKVENKSVLTTRLGTFFAATIWMCLIAIFISITFAICYTIVERVL